MTAQHVALDVQRDMREIADLWPRLQSLITGGGNGDKSGVRRPPGSKPPIDVHIADVIVEITEWVVFLARALMDETDWTPADTRTQHMLREIADMRVGHFVAHPDEALAAAVAEDAARLAKLANATVNPSGQRTIRLGIPCLEHGTSDLGERVVCTGQYATTLDAGERIGDLVCTQDTMHRLTPLEWQRAQRHDPARDRDMDALLFGGQMRHMSERIGA